MTSQPLPIACSLTASELQLRLGEVAAIAAQSLIDRRPIQGGERLTFRGGSDLRARLDGFVAAESECCPFFDLKLASEGDRHVLDITGPPEARPVIAELFVVHTD